MSATVLLLLSLPVLALWLGPAVLFTACASFGPCLRLAEGIRRALARGRLARSHG